MNIVCFPVKTLETAILRNVLRGGLDKIREADALLIGGHSVEDNEIKYGLAVTGIVHPDNVFYNRGAKAGDKLILTKPLGTGIISTAIKAQKASRQQIQQAVKSMTQLNRKASEMMIGKEIHSCTDITGFGLLGHACEMIEDSDVGMIIHSAAVPVLDGVQDCIENGFVPGGLYRNKDFRIKQIVKEKTCPDWLLDLLFDPETAGGLFFSLPGKRAEGLARKMRDAGIGEATVIGEIVREHPGKIRVD